MVQPLQLQALLLHTLAVEVLVVVMRQQQPEQAALEARVVVVRAVHLQMEKGLRVRLILAPAEVV
jgi:hypothetical protein